MKIREGRGTSWKQVRIEGVRLTIDRRAQPIRVDVRVDGKWTAVITAGVMECIFGANLEITGPSITQRLRRKGGKIR